MKLNRYEKELARVVADRFADLTPAGVVEELCRIGVVDHTLCKVLAVRTWVDEQIRAGHGKVDSMWSAADHFCSTYEYIRKCMYYYKDVNLS
jgi:hypothetical protein